MCLSGLPHAIVGLGGATARLASPALVAEGGVSPFAQRNGHATGVARGLRYACYTDRLEPTQGDFVARRSGDRAALLIRAGRPTS